MGKAAKVLIVDDHPLFRDALDAALQLAFPDHSGTHHSGSLADAVQALQNERFDLILLDLNLSDATAFDGLSKLTSLNLDCPIVVVSATDTPAAFSRAHALGARGYLPKSMTLEDLSAALVTTLDGGSWFPEAIGDAAKDNEATERIASLTPAQRRVLTGLSDGLLNKQIAFEMNISVATVKAHMTAIFRKLGANNRTQALLIYQDATSLGGPPN
ncbi:MAG: response regulator [Hyphomonas sp.]